MPSQDKPLLQARGVVKHFGQVRALRGADFDAPAGQVTALVGDNGAGKSTLVKILSGTLAADDGEVLFDGERVNIDSPVTARALGMETVYQDLSLASHLDAAANVFLGREMLRPGFLGRLGFLDSGAMQERTAEAFATVGVGLQDTSAPVNTLSGGQRQSVAVGRAVTWVDRLVFMDEPTAALGVVQSRNVRDLIRRVRDQGIAVVLISHNMPDVFDVADRIQVMRHGRRVASWSTEDTSMDQVVSAMTGALSDKET